jgi:ABC-type Mn2+/Zn2+ transport system ATPase subunit
MTIRLIDLTIRNFRGFGSASMAIDLSGDLMLLYGPNGHGKTSLAEAVEWLFYGTTKRRQRGEEFSRAEYAGTFANAHGHIPTEVALRVHHQGRDVVLTRRLGDKETSTTFVDGQRADFGAIGILPLDAHYPVVAQHDLQTFIHSKPKDRRDAICAALGLDELTSLKSSLESARSSFQRTPPLAVAGARKRLAELAPGLANVSTLVRLAQRWAAKPATIEAPGDEQALVDAAAMLAGEPAATVEEALVQLRRARERASKSVFDITPIEPHADHHQLRGAAEEQIGELTRAAMVVDDRVSAFAGVTAAGYSAAILSFWKQGLELAPTGDECPMCESPTLTNTQRETLERRVREAKATIDANDELTKALASWQQTIAPTGTSVAAIGLQGADDAGKVKLKQLLGASADVAQFLAVHDDLTVARRELGQTLRKGIALGLSTRERCASPEGLPALILERQAWRKEIMTATASFFDALDAYKAAWDETKSAVAAKIAADEIVSRIDGVGKALRGLTFVGLLVRYAAVLDETQALIRSIEGVAQRKQATLLRSRGKEVKDLYALLNPGAPVGFDAMEPANDSMKLHAVSFGVRMPAAANLSECQLNCLGLAVWLMRATTPTSPFGFVLLDDPVQAMDDDHAEAFVAQVIPYLLDSQRKQVVVLSHVRAVIDKLRHLNIHRDMRHYHYENFEIGGPVIVRQLRLQKMLAEIKGAAGGNEANREFAVDRLRVLVEIFVRELHLKVTGTPPPSNYDTANSGQLADLFRAVPGTDPSEYVGMKDTISFCDPAHHTQAGYAVPLKTNIQPHVDRVGGLMKKYALI